jgi:predicted Zn finger-like uncharacterized protein
MAISTICPHCESRFSLSDGLRGKKVRCKKCNGVFAVEEAVLDAQDATAAISSDPDPNRGPRVERSAAPPARPRRRDDEEDTYRDRLPSGGSSTGLIIGLCVGGGVLMLLLIGLGLFFALRPSPEPEPPVADNNPLAFPFGNVPQGFPDLRQLPPQGDPVPANADPITLAVFKLKRKNDHFSQSDAAHWLENARVDEKRRAEVVQALKGVIDNLMRNGPRKEAVQALATWATRDDTRYLCGLLDDNDRAVQEAALYVLAKLKDPSAAEAIVAVFPHHRDRASDTLKAIGSGAQAAVRTLLDNQDNGIRIKACEILKVIGTAESHQALLETTEDPDRGVSEAARNALPANKRPAVYGPQLTMRLNVHVANNQAWPAIEKKLKDLADSPKPKCKVHTSGDYKWVDLSPVKCDAETFARKISFAKVVAVHSDQRLIYIDPGQ